MALTHPLSSLLKLPPLIRQSLVEKKNYFRWPSVRQSSLNWSHWRCQCTEMGLTVCVCVCMCLRALPSDAGVVCVCVCVCVCVPVCSVCGHCPLPRELCVCV